MSFALRSLFCCKLPIVLLPRCTKGGKVESCQECGIFGTFLTEKISFLGARNSALTRSCEFGFKAERKIPPNLSRTIFFASLRVNCFWDFFSSSNFFFPFALCPWKYSKSFWSGQLKKFLRAILDERHPVGELLSLGGWKKWNVLWMWRHLASKSNFLRGKFWNISLRGKGETFGGSLRRLFKILKAFHVRKRLHWGLIHS